MTTIMRLLAVALLVVPVFAADIPGFALWRASELKKRDEALSKKVGPDHSARETLAEYDDHRLRFLYRDADGFPEQHDNIVDVVIVQSGEGTLHLGGKMIDSKGSTGSGEFLVQVSRGEKSTRSEPVTSFTFRQRFLTDFWCPRASTSLISS